MAISPEVGDRWLELYQVRLTAAMQWRSGFGHPHRSNTMRLLTACADAKVVLGGAATQLPALALLDLLNTSLPLRCTRHSRLQA